MTPRMRGKIHATLGELHVTDRAARLAVLSTIVYRPITSSNDLTFDEARICIDVLSAATKRDDPRAYLDALGRAFEASGRAPS